MSSLIGRNKKWLSLAMIVMMLATMILPNGLIQKAYAAPESVAGWTFSATNHSMVPSSGTDDNKANGLLSISGNRSISFGSSSAANQIYASGWTSGSYWQAKISTTGYSELILSSKQHGSSTGPKDFKLQWSLDGTDGSFVDVPNGVVELPSSAPGSPNLNVSLPAELDNQPVVYIRWVNYTSVSIGNGTTGSGGNSRLYDIDIEGVKIGDGGSDDPGPSPDKTDKPVADNITFPDLTHIVGVTGAVYENAQVAVYFSDSSLAGSGQATSDGSFHIAIDNPQSKTTVYVQAQRDGKDPSDKVAVNYTGTVSVSGVTLDKSRLDLNVSGTGQLTAAVQPSTATNKAVTWSSDNESVATVDATGKVTGVDVGTATITVKTADGNYTADATVNVTVATTYKPGDVVFSQLYINGGNSGAFYNTKFFELYNTTDQDIHFNSQWAIIYTSAGGKSFGAGTPLTGTIKAHGYYLVTGGSGTNGANLPVESDQTTTLGPSGSTGGILTLANSTTGLTDQDDPKAIDMVAYGNGTNTNFTMKTDHWGSPFYNSSVGGGTLLRKTDAGSDPRVALGIGNGYFTKNPSNDFVLNAPNSTGNPEEIRIRNSKYMVSPDAVKISFANSGDSAAVTGAAGSVPASSTVKAYVENGDGVTAVGQATAASDGSFTFTFADTNNSQSVYVTHTDMTQPVPKESAYARIDAAGNSAVVIPIAQLRNNDANGLLLNIGYAATIEGVVTSANDALGTEPTNFYVQDATGGISVISGQSPAVQIQPGHQVKVTGKLIFTAGAAQFVSTDIVDEGAGTTPDAAAIALGDLSAYGTAEPLEGKLVSFKAKVSNIPASGPDYDITVVDDANNTAIVRILALSGIDVAGGAIAQGETYTFTGIVGQSKKVSPYTAGYLLQPRSASDVQGELQLSHTPLSKAYIDVDVSLKATAKFAESVTIWYKGESDPSYTSVPMVSSDALNYNGTILKANMPTGKLMYYIEAVQGSNKKSVGDPVNPISIDIVPDTDGPDVYNMLPADGDEMETGHPFISADLDDPNGVAPASISIKIDDVDFTAKAVITATGIKLTLADLDNLSVGIHTVSVSAQDHLNNLSTHVWSFKILPRFTGGNHYYGTTHNHTQISHDADGDPEDALKAAEYHNYDWFAFSDHSHDIDSSLAGSDSVDHNGMPERTGGSDWQLTKDLATEYTKDGSFVVFPAFEMTSTTWGHSNVFGTTNFIDRVQNGGKYQNLQNYYAWTLTYDNIVAQFNHPAMSANAFDNFIPYDKNVDRLFTMLEVGNGSGKYSYANAENKFFSALDLGWHVAPTYGEDNHDATWGQTNKRTVIVADSLSQESLLDAMRRMHVYMTEDPNAKLDVLASGWYMGSTTDTKNLEFDITGSDSVLEDASDPKYSYLKTVSNDNVAKIELISNGGRVVDSYTPIEDSTSFNWTPSVNVMGGQQWFVVRVTQKDGDRIYSSPIWSPEDPISVKVNDVSPVDGAIVSGVPAGLQAGLTNLGTVDINDITAKFYYDQADSGHLIGEAVIPSLDASKSATTSVIWANPIAGDHKIIVILSSTDKDLGDNKYEQTFSIKAPLGKTILIDASKQNENTTQDSGTYKDNLKLFTLMMRQQGYTVMENSAALSDSVLSNAAVLYISHPATAYGDSEIAAIKKFVADGGSLLLAEKSNYGSGTNQNLNAVLSAVGSSLMVNNDEIMDETTYGNFWSNPLTSNFAVRAHPTPVANGLTDFVPTIEYYSGPSLAKNDGSGNKVALTDSDTVTILVRGNDSTFQDSPQIKSDTVQYNVQTSNGSKGPVLTDVTGGSAIPLVASETVGSGRIILTGMNIFNDKQMDQTYNAKGNDPFALNAVNWLSHLEPKVVHIADARNLPDGTNVVVQGKVTTAAGVFYDAAYIQDDTGGIMAFSEVPAGSLQLGDTVRVYGHIGTFENDKELMFDKFDNSIVKIGSGTPVQPKLLKTGEAVTEQYQGQLVQVQGKVTSLPDANSIVVNDGTGDVLVFVDGYIVNESGVPIPQLHVGDTLTATGMSGKYSQGTRIRVRDTRELLLSTAETVPVTGVTLNKSAVELTVGGTETLTATVQPSDATNQAVTWTTSDEHVATVDNNGKVTAVAAGTATITVTTADGSYSAAATVTVTTTIVNVTGVTLNKSAVELTVGGTETLTATVQPSDATNQAVTWTTSDEHVATVDNNGKVTAVAAGTATITVTTADGSYSAAATVTVVNNVITVDPGQISNANGKATVEIPANTAEIQLPPGTAEQIAENNLEVKSDNIVMEVPSDLMKQLTGMVTADELKDSTISLKLNPLSEVEKNSIIEQSMNASNEEIKLAGDIYEFKFSITTSSGNTAVLSTFDKPITLKLKVDSSIDPNLAGIYYIADDGKLQFIEGEYEDGYIVAQISHFSKYAVLTIHVTGLTLNKNTVALKAGAAETLIPNVQPADATNQTVIWTSSDSNVATVDANGKVTAVSVGTATITAKTFDGGYDATSTVTVTRSSHRDHDNDRDEENVGNLPESGTPDADTPATGTDPSDTTTDTTNPTDTGNTNTGGAGDGAHAVTFTDVPNSHWAANVIKELAAKQIVSGTSAAAFEPERNVTRAEFTALLVRALKLTEHGETVFTDVLASDWYADAISIAVKAGIVQGKSATLFDANAQISREEMVTMLMRAYEYSHGKATATAGTSFSDEDQVSEWAAPYVKEASALNLIQGRAAGQFDPQGMTTRAEAAQVIYNLLNK